MTQRATTKYSPTPPPQAGIASQFIQWIVGELRRVAAAMEAHEATTINYGKEVITQATTATTKLSWRNGQKQVVVLGASTTLVFDPPMGVCNIMLRLVEDGTGGWSFTLPSEVKWAGGVVPTWVTSANAVNVLSMYFDGEDYHAAASVDSK